MAITVFPKNALQRPSTSVTVNTDALSGSASTSDKQLMLIGTANGGQPGQVYSINSYANAKDIFKGGDLLDAIEAAFNPTEDGTSAGTILALRVGTATQAQMNIGGLQFKSLQYSSDANKIQLGMQDNTLTGGKNLHVVYQPDKYNYTYTGLGNLFTVSYSGTAKYASMEIVTDVAPATTTTTTTTSAASSTTTTSTTTAANGNGNTAGTDVHTGFAIKLVLKTGNTSSDAVIAGSFDLGDGLYEKTADVVNDINAIAGFSAEYTGVGNKIGVKTKYYDAIPETALTTDGVTVTSIGGDIVNTLAYDAEVAVDYNPAAGEPTDFMLTTMQGGSDGSVPTSWAEDIALFANESGYYLVPLTDDPTIHAEAVAFATDRTDNGNPTRVILGGGTNETVKELTSRAAQLRDKRTVLVGNSGSRLMNDGTTKHLPGYELAAMIGGLASGLDIGESITFKTLDLVDLDQKFTSEQLDMLDNQGVIPIEYVRNRSGLVFRVADDINTYPDDDDPVAGQMSAGEASDFLVTDMRDMLDSTYIGKRIGIGAAKEIKTSIISFLTSEVSKGTILDFDESDIAVTVQGNQANITITVAPALVIKKITVGIIYTNETLTA